MLSEELKKKITDAAVLAEVDKLEEELNNVTRESIGRKGKIRDYEGKYNPLLEKLKKLELDPEGDLEAQLTARLEKSKAGLKPASELEALMKKVDKLSQEVGSWKTTAEKATAEAVLAKAKSAFAGKLSDHFGKAADMILDYATMKGIIAVKDGVPGVMADDDFTPLQVEKGTNAIDVLRKMYPQFAITKQQPGGKDVNTKPASGEAGAKTMSIDEFETLPHGQKQTAIKEGVKIEG